MASLSSSSGKVLPGSSLLLKQLRCLMREHNLQGYIVPTADAHNSEYVRDVDKRREYISGFTGSAGTAVITMSNARLWTDGRYFLQASEELGDGWKLMKDRQQGTPSIPEWLVTTLQGDATATHGNTNQGNTKYVGYDPNVVSISTKQTWQNGFKNAQIDLAPISTNLIDAVWGEDKPKPKNDPFIFLNQEFTGKSAKEKIEELRGDMRKRANGADISLVTALDEIAWLLNIRGSDIAYNPVGIAFVVVTMKETIICTNVDQVRGGVEEHFAREGIHVRPYEEFSEVLLEVASDLMASGSRKPRIWLDENTCNSAVYSLAAKVGTVIRDVPFPIALRKAIKNPVEIRGMRESHIRDGAAVVRYLAWLEEQMKDGNDGAKGLLNEVVVADKLESIRSRVQYYKGLSFETISSSGPNGAIIHYAPKRENCRKLSKSEMYLCDSGGQYLDGTTDVTRTVHFGDPTEHEIKCFTRVLQGHIALASAIFPAGTPGHKLDLLARLPLHRDGLDYRHGTGHGVGCFLNVHEGPHGIGVGVRSHYKGGFREGMTTSNEPGYYEDGSFGIRIENVLICEEASTKFNFGDTKYLKFSNLTMVPLQRKLIDVTLLSSEEIEWIDDYHKQVRDKLLPCLGCNDEDQVARQYLLRETEPIENVGKM